jgi:glycosyltransferase involved in cell wall biosynthesis
MKVVCLPNGIPLDFTIQFANSLSKTEEIMIVLPDYLQFEEHLGNINKNINLCIVKNVKHSYLHPLNLFKVFKIIKIVKEFDPDIIHVQSGDLLTILISSFLNKSALITTFHDARLHPGWEKEYLLKFIRYWVIKKSKKIFVHGRTSKRILMENYDIPDDKIYSIPIGEHNVAPFKKFVKKNVKEEKAILFFGWIAPRKGLEYLIEAMPKISKEVPGSKIIIAGKTGDPGSINTEYFKKCQNLINNKDNFEIYDEYISYEFGAKLFQRCCVVVLPYVEITQSGVVPVAYSFKKPVVVTDVGALKEVVEDGVTGFVVPPEDSKALAEAIIKILKNEELRRQMGKNAYKKLKTELSWSNITEKIIKVYKLVLGS